MIRRLLLAAVIVDWAALAIASAIFAVVDQGDDQFTFNDWLLWSILLVLVLAVSHLAAGLWSLLENGNPWHDFVDWVKKGS